MNSDVGEQLPTLRRNGKPPSCEPCRKSKYSCDHNAPTCDRCRRRGISDKCVYHPAPMKGLTTPKVSKAGTKRARSSSSQKAPSAPSPTHLHTRVSAPALRNTPISTPPPRIALDQEPGFIGSTGYNAVLTESGLDSHIEAEETAMVLPGSLRPRRLREAFAVLELLADLPHLEKIIDRWNIYDRSMSIIGPFAAPLAAAIKEDLCKNEIWKSDEKMEETANKLFTNTDRRVSVGKNTRLVDYYLSFVGENLRWEALCIIFTACGLCCNCLRCDEPLYDFVGHSEEDRQEFMYKLMQASNACISFCEEAGQLSDLAIWALLENSIYNSQVLGDAHYITWRKVGDLSTAIFAQGFHQESKDMSRVPFWLVEMRRRGLGSAYSIDKLLCTFVGRPPRISQRYCTIHLPLDLEYDELALEGDALETALANIGQDGWNTTTANRKSVYGRCFILCALIREEVLEVSLGPPKEDLLEKAEQILSKNRSLMESLPEYIRFRPGGWTANDSTVHSFFAAQEYLDILYNDFMLRRTLVRQLRYGSAELLDIAQQILAATLEASTTRFARTTNAACVPWMAVLYGLPAAGVLALELLQQKTRSTTPPPGLQRSKVIQDLSVFISSLKWVHAPCDGNYQIVEQARKTLQQILDRILSDAPIINQQQKERQVAELPTPDSNISPFGDSNQISWDLSWLDNADFDADFWMHLPDRPFS